MRGALLSASLARYAVLALRAGSMVVLARLLTAEEFGAFAIAAAIVAVIGALSEFGLVSYLVRHPGPEPSHYRVAVALSGLTTILAIAAVVAATVFVPNELWDPELKALVLVLVAGLAFQPLAIPAQVRLQRELRFVALGVVEVARAATLVGTAFALALGGGGAMSLAVAGTAEQIVGAMLVIAFVGRGWFVAPGLAQWRDAVRFGRGYTVASVLSSVGDAGVMLLLGRALGYEAVGLFNRAQMLVGLANKAFVDGVGQVILPALALELRTQGNLARSYIGKVAYLGILYWPFFAFLALEADGVVRLLLGEGWDAAAGLVRILCLMGVFMPFTQMSMKFYVALDDIGAYTSTQFAVQVTRLALTGAGALVSLEAACLGFALATHGLKAVLVVPRLHRLIGYRWSALGREVARGLAVCAAAIAGPLALAAWAPEVPAELHLASSVALAALGWAIAIHLVRHPAARETSALVARARAARRAAWRRRRAQSA